MQFFLIQHSVILLLADVKGKLSKFLIPLKRAAEYFMSEMTL